MKGMPKGTIPLMNAEELSKNDVNETLDFLMSTYGEEFKAWIVKFLQNDYGIKLNPRVRTIQIKLMA